MVSTVRCTAPHGAVAFFRGRDVTIGAPLRTIVYIDGFNFYHGMLKPLRSYKWLDLDRLFTAVLGPRNALTGIKYFTARTQPTIRDPSVNIRQESYLNALASHCPRVQVQFGHFLRNKTRMENCAPPPNTLEVWKTEEKGSDVNLALHVLNDAWQNAYDCAVIVSNDSDLAEALRLVKTQHGKVVGLITPGLGLRIPGVRPRRTSSQLLRYADFTRTIRPNALAAAQLPDPIPGTTIVKPASW